MPYDDYDGYDDYEYDRRRSQASRQRGYSDGYQEQPRQRGYAGGYQEQPRQHGYSDGYQEQPRQHASHQAAQHQYQGQPRQAAQRQQRSRNGGGSHFAGQEQPRRQAAHSYQPYADPRQQRGGRQPYGQPQPRRRSALGPIIGIAVVALVVFLGLWFFVINPINFGVKVNGQEVTVHRGDKVVKLVEEGYVQPKAGNLLAVDGSVITEGGGTILTATINGAPADAQSELVRGAEIQVSDGVDVTEEFTSTEEVIPFSKSSNEATASSYYLGSFHLLQDGKDGKKVVRTGNVSGKQVSEVIEPAQDAGYIIYTPKPGEDKVICLTFDDGPWSTTKDVLDVLEANGAKATFFTIGQQIADYTDVVKRAVDMGCEIATHTWDHADGSGQGVNITFMSAEEQVQEVEKGYKAIADALGQEPTHVLRAPGGNFYGDAVTNLWNLVDVEVGWDVDTEDWRRPGSDTIAERILSVEPGQVILMHDGGGDRSQTVEALRQALPILKERGYSFITVSEMLAYGVPESAAASSSSTSTTSEA